MLNAVVSIHASRLEVKFACACLSIAAITLQCAAEARMPCRRHCPKIEEMINIHRCWPFHPLDRTMVNLLRSNE